MVPIFKVFFVQILRGRGGELVLHRTSFRQVCEGQADVDRFFPRSYDMSSASEVQEMDSLDGGRNMEEDDYQKKTMV